MWLLLSTETAPSACGDQSVLMRLLLSPEAASAANMAPGEVLAFAAAPGDTASCSAATPMATTPPTAESAADTSLRQRHHGSTASATRPSIPAACSAAASQRSTTTDWRTELSLGHASSSSSTATVISPPRACRLRPPRCVLGSGSGVPTLVDDGLEEPSPSPRLLLDLGRGDLPAACSSAAASPLRAWQQQRRPRARRRWSPPFAAPPPCARDGILLFTLIGDGPAEPCLRRASSLCSPTFVWRSPP